MTRCALAVKFDQKILWPFSSAEALPAKAEAFILLYMAKPKIIELSNGLCIPILYDDRVVLAIDKPAGWLLAPADWDRTGRNLQLALMSSLNNGDHWANSRRLQYIRFIHRLDADTSGVLLMAKSLGALTTMSQLFESRAVKKKYLAVVQGIPKQAEWTNRNPIGQDPAGKSRMKIDYKTGKDAETHFRVLQTSASTALIEANPVTGRTHQIRVHLAESGHPVLGDALYGPLRVGEKEPMALRAVEVSYLDPFQKRQIRINALTATFLAQFGFPPPVPVVANQNRDDAAKQH